jgi:hypothetical protein
VLPNWEQHSVVHQITEVRLIIGLEVPRFFNLIASRSVLFQLEWVFILPMVPQAA